VRDENAQLGPEEVLRFSFADAASDSACTRTNGIKSCNHTFLLRSHPADGTIGSELPQELPPGPHRRQATARGARCGDREGV